jgi:VanZ family protein
MKSIFKYYWPAILWALFVFTMCTVNLGSVGHSPMFFPGFDKLTHCGFMFVLVVLYSFGLIKQQSPPTLSYKTIAFITAVAIFYGGLIEILQLTIFTWRSGEWNDFFADSLGACMGAFSVIITVKAMEYEKK